MTRHALPLTQGACPMCGRAFDRDESNCSNCGELTPAMAVSLRNSTRLDTILASVFGSFAIGLSSLAVFRCYQFLSWRLMDGPRAQEFADADTLAERIAIVVDIGRMELARTTIICMLFTGIPAIVLLTQATRQYFGARRLLLRRVFWLTAVATWTIVLTLLLITVIG